MPAPHDTPERLHHAHVRLQGLQGVEQGSHEGDDQEDVEQLFGCHEAGRKDADQRADRVARDGQHHEESADYRWHHHVGPQDHRQDDGGHAEQVHPVSSVEHDVGLHARFPL
ncbi:hypothetical protein G6F35_016985 [Rhizopus arrhizus]|nr:hypothetical protein G6F35_016985 [Rhizopus arrhizus]KAG1387301.1 hypothetical protein G6F60_014174 [Rhizopus arrhizus]KAG1481236.1 hypothetical protein G6F53_014155 [Rhizopus delemar]